jgi:hypothetical protein
MAKKIGIGAEGLIHKNFADLLRVKEYLKQINCVFWSYNAAGEKRSPITGALLKAKGLKTGQADYTFYYQNRNSYNVNILFLEFKAKKGKQSESQKDFEKRKRERERMIRDESKFEAKDNVNYEVCYSVDEAVSVLEKFGIMKGKVWHDKKDI